MEEGSTAGQPIHCKAAVIWTPGDKYKMETVIVAAPKENQVRIKILYAAICHTDVTVGRWKELAPLFPLIPGHEAVGVVESVGEGVTNVKAGDHVLPFMQGQCGQCLVCKVDRSNMCREMPMRVIAYSPIKSDKPIITTEDGKVISILGGVSAFSEYTVLYKGNVVKLSPEAPLEKICMLSCGVGTGIGAAWKVAKVPSGSTVAVFGLGTIGLAVVQACKVAGASRIIGVDTNPSKFETGKELGLTDFINPKDHDESLSTVINKLTGGGVDTSFECVGVAALMSEAVLSTVRVLEDWMKDGVTVILGVTASPTDELKIKTHDIVQGKTVFGSVLGGLKTSDLPDLVERCTRKEFQLDPYITHKFPFSQINEAMVIFDSGNCLRCVLQMGL